MLVLVLSAPSMLSTKVLAQSEPLSSTSTNITRTFSYPTHEFLGDQIYLVQNITWSPDGTTTLIDNVGNKFSFALNIKDGDFTLLQNSTVIDQRIIGKGFQYDVIWYPLKDSDGYVKKYKFDIIGTSEKGHQIKFALNPNQKFLAKEKQLLAVVNDGISNSTGNSGIGIDWSDAVAAGYNMRYDSALQSIVVDVGRSFNIDPTTVDSAFVALSPASSDYYEGERRIVTLDSNAPTISTTAYTMYAFYFDGFDIVYKTSSDGGSTWSANAIVAGSGTGTISGDAYRWTVVKTTVSGTTYVTLLYFTTSGSTTSFNALRGTASGSGTSISWGSSTALFSVTGNAACGTGACSAVVASPDTSGNIYAAFRWIPSSPSNYQYQIMKSIDGGSTWSTSLAQTSSSQGSRIEMALTKLASGKMLFAYATFPGSEFTYRIFDGTSWGSATNTSGAGMTTSSVKHVSSDSDGANNGYVAFLSSGNSGSLKLAKWSSSGTFSSFTTVDISLSHTLPSITITPDGVYHIYTISGGLIKDTKKTNAGASWQAPSNPFGSSFTSPNQLTSAISYSSALWVESTSPTASIRNGIVQLDTDSDGIYDNWETNGIDSNWDGTMDLTLSGANSQHKDIYIEIDYMQFHQPSTTALNNVINAFSNAPVTNPNGVNGINLHLNVDEQVAHQDNLIIWTGFDAIKSTNFGTSTERASANAANILAAKAKVYHYNLWIHNQDGTTSSGIAELPGNDFIVSLGSFTSVGGHNVGSTDEQQGTLMHELGHNLNLHHGGSNDDNCKPNYLSVMSYAFQFANYVSTRPLDYSRSALATLTESNLSEPNGVSTSTPSGLTTAYGPSSVLTRVTGQAFDWNRDGDFTDTGVSQNINNFGIGGCSDATLGSLTGFNDWPNLRLNFVGSTDYADGAHSSTANNEMTMETVREIRISNIKTIDQMLQNVPDNAFHDSISAKQEKANFHHDLITSNASAIESIKHDDIRSVISVLEKLRGKLDGAAGGNSADDLIINHSEQERILEQLDNIIGTFKRSIE